MKRCRTCGKEKEEYLFYRNPQTADKLTGQCKKCCSAYNQRNREQNRAYQKAYREDVKNGKRVPRPRWRPKLKEVA